MLGFAVTGSAGVGQASLRLQVLRQVQLGVGQSKVNATRSSETQRGILFAQQIERRGKGLEETVGVLVVDTAVAQSQGVFVGIGVVRILAVYRKQVGIARRDGHQVRNGSIVVVVVGVATLVAGVGIARVQRKVPILSDVRRHVGPYAVALEARLFLDTALIGARTRNEKADALPTAGNISAGGREKACIAIQFLFVIKDFA